MKSQETDNGRHAATEPYDLWSKGRAMKAHRFMCRFILLYMFWGGLGGEGVMLVPSAGYAQPLTTIGSPGFDMVLDSTRQQLFVSVPYQNEVVIISTQTQQILKRVLVGSVPQGIDLSHDGTTLYVALNGAGEVALINLQTFNITRINVEAMLGTSLVYDVIEAKPNRVFVSGSPNSYSGTSAYIAMIKRDENDAVVRVADNRVIRYAPWFEASPDTQFLYISERNSSTASLYKMNLSADADSIVLEDQTSSSQNVLQRLVLSPDGSRIYMQDGRVLDTTIFNLIGNVEPGIPLLNQEGTLLYVGESSSYYYSSKKIRTYDTTTLTQVGQMVFSSSIQHLALSPDSTSLFVLAGNSLYAVELQNGIPVDNIPPPVPNMYYLTVADGQLSIRWNSNSESDLSHFVLYRSLTDGFTPSAGDSIARVNKTYNSYLDTGLTNHTTYYYRVTAVDSSGNKSLPSAQVSGAPRDVSAPAAPANLTATAGNGRIGLLWSANTESDLSHYLVLRRLNYSYPNVQDSIARVYKPTTIYDDVNVTNGLTYYYRIVAVDSSGNFSYGSNTASADPATPFIIDSIRDVPNDQGHRVRIRWKRIATDVSGISSSKLISKYTVWRRIDPSLSTVARKQLGVTATPPGGWDFVREVPAVQDSFYHVIVPTLADSTFDGIYHSVFFVRAHGTDPLAHFETQPDSGYSIDNLEPSIPVGTKVVGITTEGDVTLAWDDPVDADFNYCEVFRSNDANFTIPVMAGKTPETEFTDSGLPMGTTVYYRLAVYDFAGNRSEYSEPLEVLVHPVGIEGAAGTTIPKAYSLDQNAPNPFNPNTTIRYGLPKTSFVDLVIYDMLGREVRRLVQEALPAGYHTVVWDGRNSHGLEVASGVYFYQIRSDDFREMKKMTLIK